jgi:transposase-like protein
LGSEETLAYCRLPLSHHKHMKSTNMLERLNQKIKRRTHVVRIFSRRESRLRLVLALERDPQRWNHRSGESRSQTES